MEFIPGVDAAEDVAIAARLTQQGLEHIVIKHWASSARSGVSKFAEGTTARGLKSMIKETTSSGASRSNTFGRSGSIFEKDLQRSIGTDLTGQPTSWLRVVVRSDGTVTTAFPFSP